VRAFPAGAAVEIHLPGHVRTFRDFCVHLGIITLGIQDLRRFGADAGALTPEQRRALAEELRHYESFTHVIEMISKGTLRACDRALQ
jgi:hypothetical protein